MKKITLKIDGMLCGMCESHVNEVVRNTMKVKKVTSSHKSGETVILCETGIDKELLTAAIERIGYRLLDVQEEEFEKKSFFSRK